MRDLYSGNTLPSQGGAEGSIPLSRSIQKDRTLIVLASKDYEKLSKFRPKTLHPNGIRTSFKQYYKAVVTFYFGIEATSPKKLQKFKKFFLKF